MILYHTTARANLASILDRGIIPCGSPLGFASQYDKKEGVSFFETRALDAQPGDAVFLRIESDLTDAVLLNVSEAVPYHGISWECGYIVPPSWVATADTIPPHAIEGIADPPATDRAHLAAFVQGAARATAQGGLDMSLIDPVRASAWRSVRHFQHRTRRQPWESSIDLACRIEWRYARRSALDVWYDALAHMIKGVHAEVGGDPEWPSAWADYSAWFNAGRNAERAALAYQDVAA